MAEAVALRHVAFEDLGLLAPLLAEFGLTLRVIDAWSDQLSEMGDPALLIVLGGPIGVYEADRFPFLTVEIDLINRRLAAGRPVLGICLGAQLISAALGAPVYPGPVKEIGWAPVQVTEPGGQSVLAPLAAGGPVLHWHGDTFDLPDGATLLAGSAAYPHQAYQWGGSADTPLALALQFHLEVDPSMVPGWLVCYGAELAAVGLAPETLLQQTRQYGPALIPVAQAVFRRYLGGFGF